MQRPAKPFTPVRFRIQPPLKKMKVGIIGFGFVGNAISNGLKANTKVFKVDPKLGTNLHDLKKFNPNIVFVCLPTPMNNDGSQNISLVEDTIDQINKIKIDCLTVIKSTIHPGNIEKIKSMQPEFVYNPEFLREKHANKDFINSNLIVFGGKNNSVKKLSEFYSTYTKCINNDYIFTDAVTASLIKYTINSFLATKVIFFNEINNLFKSSGADESWENFVNYISKDKRVGDSHMMVPGHDQRYGFGGACLPKDANAIVQYAESLKVDLSLIKKTIKANNKIRAKYNNQTDREDEQNIKYNTKREE